ncbi:MAG: arginine--tRNA ligase, partial [Desulfofustis sp.]
MIRRRVKAIVDHCFTAGVKAHLWSEAAADKYTVEVPKHENQGDFSTNIALVVAGIEKRSPREVAAQVAERLSKETALIDSVEVAGPGFVNLTIVQPVWQQLLMDIEKNGTLFGKSTIGDCTRVMVEFVSANPTG